jgi:hypothetical protein
VVLTPFSSKVQGVGAPAWVMVKVCVATTIVALRLDPVLAATWNCTVPFPLPFAPDDTVIQLAVVLVNQVQFPPAVTLAVPDPPEAGKLSLLTDAVKLQGGAVIAAAWIDDTNGDVPPQSLT